MVSELRDDIDWRSSREHTNLVVLLSLRWLSGHPLASFRMSSVQLTDVAHQEWQKAMHTEMVYCSQVRRASQSFCGLLPGNSNGIIFWNIQT